MSRILRDSIRLVPWALRSKIKALPVIGSLQRWVIERQLSDCPFTHTVDAGPAKGITFEITLPEDKGIWTGSFETDFARYVADAVEDGSVGYDIGAWHGFFSGVMLAQGAREVVMFEPLPINLARLEKLITLNAQHALSLQAVALGAERGVARLLQMDGTSMAKLEESPFQAGRSHQGAIQVQMETLDAIIAERGLPSPDLIKIDVEGAEVLVLQGAQQTLADKRPVVYAEIHSGELMRSVRDLLSRHNYVIEVLETRDTLSREADAVQIRARPKSHIRR